MTWTGGQRWPTASFNRSWIPAIWMSVNTTRMSGRVLEEHDRRLSFDGRFYDLVPALGAPPTIILARLRSRRKHALTLLSVVHHRQQTIAPGCAKPLLSADYIMRAAEVE
jgi:hypothetical protein